MRSLGGTIGAGVTRAPVDGRVRMRVLGADGARDGGDRPADGGAQGLGDVAVLRAWAAGAQAASAATRARVDAVNVFPVPDADTGSNVHRTLAGGGEAVAGLPADADAARVARAFAAGAAESARGSSGVIVSQWLGGLAAAVGAAADLPAALARAATAARSAVPDPQEGTVLTVARDVADHAGTATTAGATPADALAAATAAARADLGRVSACHDVLRAARVVDAGACALLVLLDALTHALRTGCAAQPDDLDLSWLPETGPSALPDDAHGHGGSGAFEVLLQVPSSPVDGGTAATAPAVGAAGLADALRGVGDAVAVAEVGGRLHAHVHTDDPAAALALVAPGVREQVVVRAVDLGPDGGPGIVVLTPSPGLAGWYATAGAVTLVVAPGAAVPGAQVRRAVTDAGSGPVLVLDAAGAGLDERALARRGGTATAAQPPVAVLDGAPDGVAVVACLAVLAAAPGAGEAAARAATHRLRHRLLPASGDDAGSSAALVRAAVDQLAAAGDEPQAVTLVHGGDVPAPVVEAVTEAVRAARPELEVVVVGPAGDPGWWVGVD